MIDTDGYRLNVGIILVNQVSQVLWAKRVGQDAWQFPQGGIKAYEQPQQALFRELREEVGLTAKQVRVLGVTKQWLRYKLPSYLIRYNQQPLCIGQKQKWFLLQFMGKETDICFDSESEKPEFDGWAWVDYWHPLEEVVYFKKMVYEKALRELEPALKQIKIPVHKTVKVVKSRQPFSKTTVIISHRQLPVEQKKSHPKKVASEVV
ncbi:MAG: RNA pyrophosphohydrolase [Beggiatoa sp. IS2]|nr:MAG: RNA pyrophosphohydrolase [Beggiatoa sp. IS2]